MTAQPYVYLVSRKRTALWAARPAPADDIVVVPDGLARTRVPASRPVVVDIDLDDADEVGALKRQDLRRAEGQERIFVVAPADRRAAVQARALGATRLVADRAGLVPARDPAKPVESVEAAGQGLKSGFDGVRTGVPIDEEEVNRASRAIQGDIGAIGLSSWLDEVRSHHAGTYQHCLVVTGVLNAFAAAMGLDAAAIATVTTGGLLHDIGKARIPVDILDKPGGLSAAERGIMRFHPIYGASFLERHGSFTPEIRAMVRSHHELLDGTGYPDRLAGDVIPLFVRMLTIADVYGALIEERAYKAPMGRDDAYAIVADMAEAGKLDKTLVRRFAAVADQAA